MRQNTFQRNIYIHIKCSLHAHKCFVFYVMGTLSKWSKCKQKTRWLEKIACHSKTVSHVWHVSRCRWIWCISSRRLNLFVVDTHFYIRSDEPNKLRLHRSLNDSLLLFFSLLFYKVTLSVRKTRTHAHCKHCIRCQC